MEILLVYLELFWAFFKIGLFGFGGGYAMLSLIQNEVVETPHPWNITASEFTDIVAISQATPGPIAFNSATYIGYTGVTNMGFTEGWGVLGSAICTIAVSLPSLILMAIVCRFLAVFRKNPWVDAVMSGLKPAVIGLIAAAALSLMNEHTFIDYKSWIFFGGTFIASIYKVNAILLVFIAGIAGFIFY